MSKITIAQLETAETSIQELTVAELDATKGGHCGHGASSLAGVGACVDNVKTTAAGIGAKNFANDNDNNLNGNGIANGDNQVNF